MPTGVDGSANDPAPTNRLLIRRNFPLKFIRYYLYYLIQTYILPPLT